MRWTDAAKVGLTVLIAAAILAGATFALRGPLARGGTYRVGVAFPNALGIQEGAYVRVRGVDFGTVEEVGLGPRNEALLTLRIREAYRFDPTRDSIRIVGGVLGFSPPYVEITPGGRRAPLVTTPEGIPVGETSASTEQLMEQADDLLASWNTLAGRVNRVTESLAQIAEDPRLRRDLRRTVSNFARASESGVVIARNMERATARAERLVRGFEVATARLNTTLRRADALFAELRGVSGEARALMTDSRGAVADTRQVVRDAGALVRSTRSVVENAGGLVSDTRLFLSMNRPKLQELLDSLNASLRQLDATLAEARTFLADTELRGDLKATAANLREATENLRGITADVRGLTADPKVQEDLRATLTSLREATAEASETFRRVRAVLGSGGETAATISERISAAELRASAVRTFRSNRIRVDLDATIPWSDTAFYRLGFFDFGEGNKINLQAGQLIRPGLWGRYGIYASKLGVGLDVGNRQRPPFSLELFGIERPRLDLRGNVPIGSGLDLTIGLENVLRRADPAIGLRYRR